VLLFATLCLQKFEIRENNVRRIPHFEVPLQTCGAPVFTPVLLPIQTKQLENFEQILTIFNFGYLHENLSNCFSFVRKYDNLNDHFT
jgi:hypothetical protein